jgi:ATP-dependent DNA ligase
MDPYTKKTFIHSEKPSRVFNKSYLLAGLIRSELTSLFVAFDLLYLNGKDLRTLPLIERKRQLRKLLRRKHSRILYLDHVENDGRLLFERIVKMDLEGMVCKRKDSPYRGTDEPSHYWIKVKNPRYSQLEGREELFERAVSGRRYQSSLGKLKTCYSAARLRRRCEPTDG